MLRLSWKLTLSFVRSLGVRTIKPREGERTTVFNKKDRLLYVKHRMARARVEYLICRAEGPPWKTTPETRNEVVRKYIDLRAIEMSALKLELAELEGTNNEAEREEEDEVSKDIDTS
jgi:hypothetical protein